MEIVKLGSKGDAVKTLQSKLGITADGIFGKDTESKVIAFQKSKGLTADGVVGNKTWEALGIVSNSKCVDASVLYRPLSHHISSKPGRKIEWLVIHFTAGGSSRPGVALNTKNVFENRPASADFCVDDRDMVQFNPDINNYYCWAVGDKPYPNTGGASLQGKASNSNCISIEICSSLRSGFNAMYPNHEGWLYTEDALNNAVKLSRILMSKFNIPLDHVIRHYDVSGKLCPGIVGWNNGPVYSNEGRLTGAKSTSEKWYAFKEQLK